MKKFLAKALFLFFCGFSLVSYGAEHTVKMLNSGQGGSMVFEPAVLKVNVGDTVKFEATEPGHNSASIPGLLPSDAKAWQGGLNQDVTVKFDKQGVYVYQCTPHLVLAMIGVVVVGDATNLQEIKENSKQITSKFVMNKDRLDSYLATLN